MKLFDSDTLSVHKGKTRMDVYSTVDYKKVKQVERPVVKPDSNRDDVIEHVPQGFLLYPNESHF